MTNNNIEDLSEIDQLATIKKLRVLSLLRNPVAALKHYRLYTIYRLPSLKVLDFKKVKEREREEAQKLYKGKKLKKKEKPKTFIPGEQLDKLNQTGGFDQQKQTQRVERVQATKEDIEAIRVRVQPKFYSKLIYFRYFSLLKDGHCPS